MTAYLRWALGGAAALALAAPGVAGAATKTVTMGASPKTTQTLQNKYGSDVNQFFPSSITVHTGDSVKFVPLGFHNTHFLGSSGKPVPIFVPTGKMVSGVNDAAGIPFWFNGQPELAFNAALGNNKLGKTLVFNGSNEINSGVSFADGPAKPMTVRFTKAGRYTYICDIHPGMKGTVRVAAKRKPVPSNRADALRAKAQERRAIANAKTIANGKPAANTVDVGRYRRGVALFGFLPATLTVPAGTTVTFRSPTGNQEPHTASFGPGDPEKDPKSYLGEIAKSFEGLTVDPRGLYPSDVPTAPAAFSSALHGNGFWSSGVIDGVTATPIGPTARVTFTTPGTYVYHCLIHTFMKATIKVT